MDELTFEEVIAQLKAIETLVVALATERRQSSPLFDYVLRVTGHQYLDALRQMQVDSLTEPKIQWFVQAEQAWRRLLHKVLHPDE